MRTPPAKRPAGSRLRYARLVSFTAIRQAGSPPTSIHHPPLARDSLLPDDSRRPARGAATVLHAPVLPLCPVGSGVTRSAAGPAPKAGLNTRRFQLLREAWRVCWGHRRARVTEMQKRPHLGASPVVRAARDVTRTNPSAPEASDAVTRSPQGVGAIPERRPHPVLAPSRLASAPSHPPCRGRPKVVSLLSHRRRGRIWRGVTAWRPSP